MSDDLLYQAFLAGFEESGEGFNGDDLSARYAPIVQNGRYESNPALEERMRSAFDQWRAKNP